jgi:hypothetical protein
MTVERMKALTVRWIITGDMYLNWALGALLAFVPGVAERAMSTGPLLPGLIWRVIGAIFLLFAAWQTWVVRRGEIGASGLVFASLMALVPVALLTIGLVCVMCGTIGQRPSWPGDRAPASRGEESPRSTEHGAGETPGGVTRRIVPQKQTARPVPGKGEKVV